MAEETNGSKPGAPNPYLQDWRNPIVLIVWAIVVGTMLLIGVAMFTKDGGVLGRMGEPQFARGLITYLFSVMTILTAVVLVLAALTGSAIDSDETKERFQRGKEILALLLGVFGTIVGFYFGSEVKTVVPAQQLAVQVTPPLLNPNPAQPGKPVTLTAAVSGGAAPYQYEVVLGEATLVKEKPVAENGWIIETLPADRLQDTGNLKVTLNLKDNAGKTATASAILIFEPNAK